MPLGVPPGPVKPNAADVKQSSNVFAALTFVDQHPGIVDLLPG